MTSLLEAPPRSPGSAKAAVSDFVGEGLLPGAEVAFDGAVDVASDSFLRIDAPREVGHEQLRSHAEHSFRAPLLERTLTLVVVDGLCLGLAAALAFTFWTAVGSHPPAPLTELLVDKWYWFPLSATMWFAVAWAVDLYDGVNCTINRVTATRALAAAGVFALCFFAAYFFVPNYIPRTYFLTFAVLMAGLVIVGRWLQNRGLERAPRHRMILIGNHRAAGELRDLVGRTPRMNLDLIGWTGLPELQALHTDHGAQGLFRYAISRGVHEIVVARNSDNEHDAVYRSLVECQAMGVRISSLAEVYRRLSRQIPIDLVDSQWIMSAMQDRVLFSRVQLAIKRAMDVAGALAAMPILGLLTIPIAIAIKLDTPGTIFYVQERTGRAGRKFGIIKFRTMGSDAEKNGAQWASMNDHRVTRVGNFLRKTRLDELPQFVNVLLGDMSLVGPRPEREQFEEKLDRELSHYFIRRLVKPGITGWAQVHYGYGASIEDSRRKLQYDAYYVRHWSLLMDVCVLLRTVGVMLGFKGR